MTPAISVVVPSYRRPQLLERCLAALAAQELPAAQFEIIVVHDGPSEAAQRLVDRWRRRLRRTGGPRLRYRAPPHGGPAAARNAGWALAAAAIVAFTDDDTEPAPSWLSSALAHFGPEVDAAWGRIVVPLRGEPTDYELDAARLASSEFATANSFVRKRLLEAVDGFDERFELAWREDSDLFFRLLERGARVVRIEDAVVLHPVRTARWGVSLGQQKKVVFDALLFKKHRALYRQRIRPAPRWDYYAIVAALTGAAGAALGGSVAVAAACLAVWTALTARFCWTRLRRTSKRWPHLAEIIVTSAAIPLLAVFWRTVGVLRFRVLLL